MVTATAGMDLEKPFDSVLEHDFMFATLKLFGFGENLIRLVKVAFHGCICIEIWGGGRGGGWLENHNYKPFLKSECPKIPYLNI